MHALHLPTLHRLRDRARGWRLPSGVPPGFQLRSSRGVMIVAAAAGGAVAGFFVAAQLGVLAGG